MKAPLKAGETDRAADDGGGLLLLFCAALAI
jgi:hypothetical protein